MQYSKDKFQNNCLQHLHSHNPYKTPMCAGSNSFLGEGNCISSATSSYCFEYLKNEFPAQNGLSLMLQSSETLLYTAASEINETTLISFMLGIYKLGYIIRSLAPKWLSQQVSA